MKLFKTLTTAILTSAAILHLNRAQASSTEQMKKRTKNPLSGELVADTHPKRPVIANPITVNMGPNESKTYVFDNFSDHSDAKSRYVALLSESQGYRGLCVKGEGGENLGHGAGRAGYMPVTPGKVIVTVTTLDEPITNGKLFLGNDLVNGVLSGGPHVP